jgi:FkbM family methyltransferase
MRAHHPVISRFRGFRGQVPANCRADFLGTAQRLQFTKGLDERIGPRGVRTREGDELLGPAEFDEKYLDSPEFDEEYFEWIDLLESVVAAQGSYTMLDLGAGFGRWSVRAAFAVRQYHGILPYRLVAVEAEPTVFEWMKLHYRDNGLDPARHTLIHAAVTQAPGEVFFYVGGPRGGPFDLTADAWYGQSVTKDYELAEPSQPDEIYQGRTTLRHRSGWRSIRVPSVTLASLLEGLGQVDLIDLDIEGQELPVIGSAIAGLNAQVKRLHIGTHDKEIEDGIRHLLSGEGWSCSADYSLFSRTETAYGTINFENGVQSWVNPRFTV